MRHKETFYPSAWAHYDLAHRGSLRLLPAETRLPALERDYRNMGVMIFGDPPPFQTILETLAGIEQDINKMKRVAGKLFERGVHLPFVDTALGSPSPSHLRAP